MRLLIIEGGVVGHHGPYLEIFIDAAVSSGNKVVVALFDCEENRDFGCRIIKYNSSVDFIYIKKPKLCSLHDGLIKDIIREFSYWSYFRNAIKLAKKKYKFINAIYLPYADYCVNAIGVLGVPFSGLNYYLLVMKQKFHLSHFGIRSAKRDDWIKKYLFRRVINFRDVKRISSLDESLVDFSMNSSLKNRVFQLNDPINLNCDVSKYNSRCELSIGSEDIVILAYGAMEYRKGIIEALKGLSYALSFGRRDIKILVCGKMAPSLKYEIQEIIERNRCLAEHVIIWDRYINNLEEQIIFSAADAVWVGYVGFDNVSGVLRKGIASGRKVIACKEGVIGYIGAKYGCSLIDPSSAKDVGEAFMAITHAENFFPDNTNLIHEWKRDVLLSMGLN